jgi:Fungal chitosanase of glycosyl hydrolase group 75
MAPFGGGGGGAGALGGGGEGGSGGLGGAAGAAGALASDAKSAQGKSGSPGGGAPSASGGPSAGTSASGGSGAKTSAANAPAAKTAAAKTSSGRSAAWSPARTAAASPLPPLEPFPSKNGVPVLAGSGSSLQPAGDVYALKPNGPRVVAVDVLRRDHPLNASASASAASKPPPPEVFVAKADIDADGVGGAWSQDSTGRPHTALQRLDGTSLDPTKIPYIVIPGDYREYHPQVSLGDYAMVSYKGKTVFGVVGDIGPKGVIGEVSMLLAASIGINPDPNRGGVKSASVKYVIFPESGGKAVPGDAATIEKNGARTAAQRGVTFGAG